MEKSLGGKIALSICVYYSQRAVFLCNAGDYFFVLLAPLSKDN